MKIGIVGLGLIGGSFAKAYAAGGHTVLAADTDTRILAFAGISGVIHGKLDSETLGTCDLVLICITPEAAMQYLRDNAPYFSHEGIVMDCCGTKRSVCQVGMELAKEYGFTYVGGHPMAGTHHSGFKYATATLYNGAPMVLVPPTFDDIQLLNRVKELLAPAGFGSLSVTTAERHDEMIAFTSQLAHVVSNAYIKSPTAENNKGFSAGSYKDMTRVAWLNPQMWAELFLENKDCLISEMDILMKNLEEYRQAMIHDDKETLVKLLADGRDRKEQVDGH